MKCWPTENLYYNTGVGTAKYKFYGSISSMTWKAADENTIRGYKLTTEWTENSKTITFLRFLL